MSLSLSLLLLLLGGSQATHFLGTVITFHPKTFGAGGTVTVVLRYKVAFHRRGTDTWSCFSGNCGSQTSLTLTRVLRESGDDWFQDEGVMTRQVINAGLFQMVLAGGNWVNNIINGISAWRAMTLVDLRTRSDTRRPNTSPQTTILPLLRVPLNCQRDFNLLAFDPDGDMVRCRNGNTTLGECNPCTPSSVLSLSPSCTLSFSSNNSLDIGPHAVQLVMEDFPRKNITLTQSGVQTTITTSHAISKIPVQFAVQVDPVVPSCTEGIYLPAFLPPTPANRAQLVAAVNQTLYINITAAANVSRISELLFSGPHNVQRNSSGPGRFVLSWTPSQSEDGQNQPICFAVQAVFNSTKYHSELRCVTVSVGLVVLRLTARVSSVVPLTEEYIRTTVLPEFEDKLVDNGLPPSINLTLLGKV